MGSGMLKSALVLIAQTKRMCWVLLCIFILAACTDKHSQEEYKNFVLGGFSPDSSKLALSYCTTQSVCKTGFFDIRQKDFTEITPKDPDHFYIPGGFSPDGTYLAITIQRNSDNSRDTQVALLKLATGEITELTNSHGHRSGPSFSHDGKKLIFARSNWERVSGKTRFSHWDIYEIDIATREERRLTAFQFFQYSSPFYLPDDQHFIFSGEGPIEYVSPTGEKGYNGYKSQFHDNLIFVLSPSGEKSLTPFFTNGDSSDFPTISADGSKVVYRARSDKLDPFRPGFTYDLFLFDGKEHKRLTKLDGIIEDTVLSSNGSMSAIVHTRRKQVSNPKLTLFNVDTGQIDSLDPAQLSDKYTADQ